MYGFRHGHMNGLGDGFVLPYLHDQTNHIVYTLTARACHSQTAYLHRDRVAMSRILHLCCECVKYVNVISNFMTDEGKSQGNIQSKKGNSLSPLESHYRCISSQKQCWPHDHVTCYIMCMCNTLQHLH